MIATTGLELEGRGTGFARAVSDVRWSEPCLAWHRGSRARATGPPLNMSDLYRHPKEYDLEHLGDREDIEFYVSLVQRLRPRKLLELGCGTGRITLPLTEQGAQLGFEVIGLDSQAEMLQKAANRRLESPPQIRERLSLIRGDMRTWSAQATFDLIVIPCSSISHLLTLQDQLAVWRQSRRNLEAGGRFLVEVTMPNMAIFADSFNVPSRALVEIDVDKRDESDGVRLVRRKTSRYLSHEQCAETRFLYEKYRDGRAVDGYIDDFVGHVFFPRELQLLFMHTGFEIEQTFGDYRGGPLKPNSPLIIMIGKVPANDTETNLVRSD
jgi:SAM-dependent methyltransferase